MIKPRRLVFVFDERSLVSAEQLAERCSARREVRTMGRRDPRAVGREKPYS